MAVSSANTGLFSRRW
jgi:uncharacterized membrane protein HdeD (DUF308 family)